MGSMKALRVLAAALALLPLLPAGAQTASRREPVLVELFTSEGCSSCPPADELLSQLDARQFVPGAEAIVLSEHVTYWNHEGWRDPFSLDAVDDRQKVYVDRLRLPSSYTPQVVVDGAAELVGNDARALSRAVLSAAGTPKTAITIGPARREGGAVTFSVQAPPGRRETLVAALARSAASSEVNRGENRGRTLHHVAVVLGVKEFGERAADGRTLRMGGAGEDASPLRLVVFLTDERTGHVTAVAERTLP